MASGSDNVLGLSVKPDRAAYTPLDFLNLREQQALEVVPKFQRRPVWTRAAKAFLIDTLLRGLPVPPIYLRVVQSDDRKKTVREVIDGQQRVSAVLDFLDGKFSLTGSLHKSYAGKDFASLSDEQQDRITQYAFACEVFQGVSDSVVLEIFARMNTYSIQLNAQELRNGKYFGFFKQSSYRLAHEHIEFWRNNCIYTERGIARMNEVELTSELLIMSLHGMQDKKGSINKYYAAYDEQFASQERSETRFRSVIDAIESSLGDTLRSSEFRRPPLFYSLFGAVYHRRFGLPQVDLVSPKKTLDQGERKQLRDAVSTLSDVIQLDKQGEPVPKNYSRFVSAAQRQTDNIQPRTTRLQALYKAAF